MAIKTIWLWQESEQVCSATEGVSGSRNKPHRYGLLMLHAGAKNTVWRGCAERTATAGECNRSLVSWPRKGKSKWTLDTNCWITTQSRETCEKRLGVHFSPGEQIRGCTAVPDSSYGDALQSRRAGMGVHCSPGEQVWENHNCDRAAADNEQRKRWRTQEETSLVCF